MRGAGATSSVETALRGRQTRAATHDGISGYFKLMARQRAAKMLFGSAPLIASGIATTGAGFAYLSRLLSEHQILLPGFNQTASMNQTQGGASTPGVPGTPSQAQYAALPPYVQNAAFWGLMVGTTIVYAAGTKVLGGVADLVMGRWFAWVENPIVAKSYEDWERFKQDALSDETTAGLASEIRDFLVNEAQHVDRQFNAMLFMANPQRDPALFAREVENKQRYIQDLIAFCAQADLPSVSMPAALSLDNFHVVKAYLEWQAFKHYRLSDDARGRLPALSRELLDLAARQIDDAFDGILESTKDPFTDLPKLLESLKEKRRKIEKLFFEWETFKDATLANGAADSLPDGVRRFIERGLMKRDEKLGVMMASDRNTFDCIAEVEKAKSELRFWLDCYRDVGSGARAAETAGEHSPHIENSALVKEFLHWERYKAERLTGQVIGDMPERPRAHVEATIKLLDRDFAILLREPEARADLRKAIQQVQMKKEKIDAFFLNRNLPLQAVPGWTPDSDIEKAEADLKRIFGILERATDVYAEPGQAASLNKDLLAGFVLMDMAKASTHVVPPSHAGQVVPSHGRWTRENDWNLWPQLPQLPNLLYIVIGPPGTGKGRYLGTFEKLGRMHKQIEVPNILQGGVASLASAQWDAMLQFDFPTSEKDDVGALVLQLLQGGVRNPVWVFNELDFSDVEGLKKIWDPYAGSLVSNSVRSEFRCEASMLCFCNWLPEEENKPLGDAAIRSMNTALRDRGTMVALDRSPRWVVEQDTIEAYRAWASLFCTPFENGAPARLTQAEQQRLQDIFKQEAFPKIVEGHRASFDGSRMNTHVPAVIGQIVRRLFMERLYGEEHTLRPGEIAAWVEAYYGRYLADPKADLKTGSDEKAPASLPEFRTLEALRTTLAQMLAQEPPPEQQAYFKNLARLMRMTLPDQEPA